MSDEEQKFNEERLTEALKNVDEIGIDVFISLNEVDVQLNHLSHQLEQQFDESDENDNCGKPLVNLASDHLVVKSEREQMDEIINILNDHDSETSEENFNNPSFDELEALSKVKSHPSKSDRVDADSLGEEELDEISGSISSKIFELIDSMKSRSIVGEDEWDNDDDTGYITVTLTDQEFFEYEDRNAALLVAERRDEINKDQGKHGFGQSVKENSLKNVQEVDELSAVNEYLADVDKDAFQDDSLKPTEPKRQSAGERRRSEIMGQHRFQGADGTHCYFNLKVIFEPYKTGFEESKDLKHPKGTILAGRYEVYDVLGSAAFSTALQCIDLAAEDNEPQWVCLKVIKNNKDYFDQSLDEIKLLQYINSRGEPDDHHVLRLIDFFYCKEHLFIVSELLKENLYEFGRYIKENDLEIYYTLERLKRISKQVLEALAFIHSLKLIHCDVKPENIVIKSFSRCEVKLIDFGSSCFTTDHLTTYIQSRSYRAPEVILGHNYDCRIDVWSVGAVIAELYTGYVLFQNDSVPTMLSRITGVLGPFPDLLLSNGRDTGKYFTLSNIVYERDEEGSFHLIFPKKTNLRSRLHFCPRFEDQSEDENLFVDFIKELLNTDPSKRLTASEALKHPWLKDADSVQFSEYVIGQPASQAKIIDPETCGGEERELEYFSGYDYVSEPFEEETYEDGTCSSQGSKASDRRSGDSVEEESPITSDKVKDEFLFQTKSNQ